jgi:hypothetical protein
MVSGRVGYIEGMTPLTIIGAGLGKAIAAHPGNLETALAEYEETMFIGSADAAAESARNHGFMFDDNARTSCSPS